MIASDIEDAYYSIAHLRKPNGGLVLNRDQAIHLQNFLQATHEYVAQLEEIVAQRNGEHGLADLASIKLEEHSSNVVSFSAYKNNPNKKDN